MSRRPSSASIRSSLAVSPSSSRPAGMPVQAATTSATSSGPTSSLTIGASSPAPPDSGAAASASSCSTAGMSSVEELGGAARGRRRAGRARPRPRSSSSSLLQRADPVEAGLLLLPPRRERGQLLLPVGELAAQPLEPLDRRRVGLLSQRHLLHRSRSTGRCSTSISTGEESISMRSREAASSTRSIALSGRKRAGDVAVGQRGRGDERGVADLHLVVRLVALLQPAQDRDGVLDAGLADVDRLEAPLERGVLLDVRRGTRRASSRRPCAARRARASA